MIATRPQLITLGPPAPNRLEDTGLDAGFVMDLILKATNAFGRVSAVKIADFLCLPYGIIGPLLRQLRAEALVDVPGATAALEAGFEYVLTTRGRERARDATRACGYVGPAPITLEDYQHFSRDQGERNRQGLTPRAINQAFSHLVLSNDLRERLGAALNAGRSMFLYGDPGNGKTTIAEAMRRLPGEVYVPHAVLVEPNAVAQVFEPGSHDLVDPDENPRFDRRWNRCRPPFVAVGGEMTLHQMNMVWDDSAGIYQASLPMRAAGGFLLIDDFGRQAESPRSLLNRWIVPLEKGVDYLALRTGKKIEVPFDMYTIFSTNLPWEALVDEAFIRRIGNKIEITDPTIEEFVEIMRRVCDSRGVGFVPDGLRYLLTKHYWDPEKQEFRRALRAYHPRDIISQLVSIAAYRRRIPALAPDLIDAACNAVFGGQMVKTDPMDLQERRGAPRKPKPRVLTPMRRASDGSE